MCLDKAVLAQEGGGGNIKKISVSEISIFELPRL